MRFTIPDQAEGIQLHGDGTRYDTKPGGSIEVDNPRHLKAIKESQWYKDGFLGGEHTYFIPTSEGATCACGLSLWPWQTECSRCSRVGG